MINSQIIRRSLLWGLLGLVAPAGGVANAAGEWSGNVALEARYFSGDPVESRQHGNNISLSAQPEYYREWDGGNQSLTISPFVRIDQGDEDRSHFDVRELAWLRAADNWELRAGISKVFWGVTESQHLVDIINQTDGIENFDGEDKLGQPMINGTLISDNGTFDLYLLLGFRERTFVGEEGRLRSVPRVDSDLVTYESSDESRHIDAALRWSHSLGSWDFAISHFSGTSRQPLLSPTLNSSGETVLATRYDLINQTGIELQATIEAWLWKLEAIQRSGQSQAYFASVVGFEYTLVGIFDSSADLGLIAEYHYDDRKNSATTPFEDDLFVGARIALNDSQSSELLFGVISDLDSDSRFFSLEASRRIGEQFKLTIEARTLTGLEPTDPLFALENDDYLLAELAWYF